MRKGCLIALEGLDGSGKSTQIRFLAGRLLAAGWPVITTREPGGTPTGDRIRQVLLDPNLSMGPRAEFLLYSASRAEHVETVIRPALDAGKIVLTDRFSGASFAYQGHGRGLDVSELREWTDWTTADIRPLATILLDVPVQIMRDRLEGRGTPDRIEQAGLRFFERAREGFHSIASSDPSWRLINAARPPEAVAEDVHAAVRDILRQEAAMLLSA